MLPLGLSLVVEAVAGRGHGFEAVVADRLAAGLARAVAAVVEALEGVLDVGQLAFDAVEDAEVLLAIKGLGRHVGLVLVVGAELLEALVLRLSPHVAELSFESQETMGAALGSSEGASLMGDTERLQQTFGNKVDVLIVNGD